MSDNIKHRKIYMPRVITCCLDWRSQYQQELVKMLEAVFNVNSFFSRKHKMLHYSNQTKKFRKQKCSKIDSLKYFSVTPGTVCYCC